MRRSVLVGAVLSLLIVWLMSCAQAAVETRIGDILKDPQRYSKEQVQVWGVISNVVVSQPEAGTRIKYRGEFDLTGEDKATIHVKTTNKRLPAIGEERYISAVVELDASGVPLLVQQGPVIPPGLIIALAALAVVAVILIVLMVKKPAQPTVAPALSTTSGGLVLGPVGISPISSAPSAKMCPKCQSRYAPTENFCEQCGLALVDAAAPGPTTGGVRPTVLPAGDTVRPSDKPTIQIAAIAEERPLADLTVIDGEGARYGTKFAVRRERQKIGRKDGMDIRLTDETVSREHATIWAQDGTFYIQDEASSSGTTVNGQKITRQSLSDNDIIQMGRTKLVFRVISGPPAGA